MTKRLQPDNHPNEAGVVARAITRAADYWHITNKQLSGMIGLSEASVSRLKDGTYSLKRNSKQWELALMFLRIFRGLDAYMGGQMDNEKAWLHAHNTALGGVPLEMMQRVEGMAGVVQYIDHMRGQ